MNVSKNSFSDVSIPDGVWYRLLRAVAPAMAAERAESVLCMLRIAGFFQQNADAFAWKVGLDIVGQTACSAAVPAPVL